jgi:hypothetical protein
LFVLLVLCGPTAGLAGWETTLSNGQPIIVDPATNRAVIQSGVGQGRPLWDGVHRLQDGSTLTIRSGIAVPNAASGRQPPPAPMLRGESTPENAAPASTSSRDGPRSMPDSVREGHCDHLLLKTCGLNRTCRDTEACQLAAQLRSMQQRLLQPGLDNVGWAEGRCREALQDPAGFPACPREPALDKVACSALARHVCSGAVRCQRTELCRQANTLLGFEQSALERRADDELLLIRQRCSELLTRHAFFPPCR